MYLDWTCLNLARDFLPIVPNISNLRQEIPNQADRHLIFFSSSQGCAPDMNMHETLHLVQTLISQLTLVVQPHSICVASHTASWDDRQHADSCAPHCQEVVAALLCDHLRIDLHPNHPGLEAVKRGC